MAAKDMAYAFQDGCDKAFEYEGRVLCGIPFPSKIGSCRAYNSKDNVVSVTDPQTGEKTMHGPCHKMSGHAKEAAPDTFPQYA